MKRIVSVRQHPRKLRSGKRILVNKHIRSIPRSRYSAIQRNLFGEIANPEGTYKEYIERILKEHKVRQLEAEIKAERRAIEDLENNYGEFKDLSAEELRKIADSKGLRYSGSSTRKDLIQLIRGDYTDVTRIKELSISIHNNQKLLNEGDKEAKRIEDNMLDFAEDIRKNQVTDPTEVLKIKTQIKSDQNERDLLIKEWEHKQETDPEILKQTRLIKEHSEKVEKLEREYENFYLTCVDSINNDLESFKKAWNYDKLMIDDDLTLHSGRNLPHKGNLPDGTEHEFPYKWFSFSELPYDQKITILKIFNKY